jgi:hypothetical protein
MENTLLSSSGAVAMETRIGVNGNGPFLVTSVYVTVQ